MDVGPNQSRRLQTPTPMRYSKHVLRDALVTLQLAQSIRRDSNFTNGWGFVKTGPGTLLPFA